MENINPTSSGRPDAPRHGQYGSLTNDFMFKRLFGSEDESRYHSSYRLHEDGTGELLYDKLQLIFLELSRFDKGEDELESWYDKWMYLFKNMARLDSRPETFREKVFDRLFDMAKIANLAPDEYRVYQNTENMGYSYQNTIDYAREEGEKIGEKRGREIGRAEGRAEGANESRIETARNLKANGVGAELIAKCTGLSLEDVLALQVQEYGK
ncbi:MAG: Rpn family recombination-promoting nuclease/putative transposase [Candidatus Cryptobacteroides sp.]